MKLLAILVLVAAASAAPQAYNPQDVQILRYDTNNDGLGTYNFLYELSDKSSRQEQGELKNVGTDEEALVMRGSYTWVGPDGLEYKVTYVADENGFQPTIDQPPGGAVPPGHLLTDEKNGCKKLEEE
ncbi:hypothetical protein evm_009012 [Chilo suppressalis]|nr:hypothetical protein evm_009012 [Chilo suppressalis]